MHVAHANSAAGDVRAPVCCEATRCHGPNSVRRAAGNTTDLQLTSRAGLARTAIKYPDDETHTFRDFEPFSWTRTLSDNWFNELPV